MSSHESKKEAEEVRRLGERDGHVRGNIILTKSATIFI